jgi:ribonuclease P protein component
MGAGERFPKRAHILKSKDFKKVYDRGRFVKKGPYVLYRLANDLKESRIGFSIGARNIRKANRRNRYKRLFREVFRKTNKKLKNNFDLVLLIRKDYDKTITYTGAETIFLTMAKEVGVL